MYAGRDDTTPQNSHGLEQNRRWPQGTNNARAGLVALRRNQANSGRAPVARGEKRRHMIELAAYYNAQRRGFVPGGELQDWLDAEQQIDARFTCAEITHHES